MASSEFSPENPHSNAAVDELADHWEHRGRCIIPLGDHIAAQVQMLSTWVTRTLQNILPIAYVYLQ